MELRHEFTVPVPVEEAWRALLDIERVAPCMPGATVEEYDGETINGTVKVKVGPITLTYRGTAVFDEKDETARRMVLTAGGKEVRGQGTARATVTATLTGAGEGTAVSVLTDLTVTGRPAQFGRGVMAEVGDKLIGRFADCLSDNLAGTSVAKTTGNEAATGEPTATGEPAAAAAAGGTTKATARATGTAEPIDLVRTAGLPVAKRLAAAALVAGIVAALVAVILRRRH
ncbi:SRPBCC family protein [Streptomyces sp. NBC_01619]|uniref:SRPBCC family protein n=1 Tax=Streptomyces sp. NBC_01619 TaxID=2975901 RepID=UPI00224CD0F7|nr:SRPBCC family protein [Streptomyces sp. NBC_01619]MCX4515492.1 SRPBCC family protein [Streptomyces sp. NBC_01619]